MLQKDNRISTVVETALKNVNLLADVNTIVGKPLLTEDGDCIIPISKITVGVLAGGGEYGKINIFNKGADLPFSAGNGSIISVKPSGFLIKDKSDNYKVLTVDGNPYEKLIEKSIEFFNDLRDDISGTKSSSNNDNPDGEGN